jgi:hypothetical protein
MQPIDKKRSKKGKKVYLPLAQAIRTVCFCGPNATMARASSGIRNCANDHSELKYLGNTPATLHSINECHITLNSAKHKPPSTISKFLLHNLFIQKMLVEKHHAYMSCSMNIRQSATMIMKRIWKKA